MVELATNRGVTTLSAGGKTSEWPDGLEHPEDYVRNIFKYFFSDSETCTECSDLHYSSKLYVYHLFSRTIHIYLC